MIVFTNGCFDILHKGHIEYLRESKKLGTRLIVGLNSDDSVRRLKGENRPVNNQWDRKLVLEELRCVDEVIIFEEDTPYELIKKITPDIITKGGDYKIEDVVGHDLAKTIIIPFLEGYSTSNVLKKL
jgi:rfaE bifunctional protein nucleotidyltransferase chain/domain